jgi:hypothetical protein
MGEKGLIKQAITGDAAGAESLPDLLERYAVDLALAATRPADKASPKLGDGEVVRIAALLSPRLADFLIAGLSILLTEPGMKARLQRDVHMQMGRAGGRARTGSKYSKLDEFIIGNSDSLNLHPWKLRDALASFSQLRGVTVLPGAVSPTFKIDGVGGFARGHVGDRLRAHAQTREGDRANGLSRKPRRN